MAMTENPIRSLVIVYSFWDGYLEKMKRKVFPATTHGQGVDVARPIWDLKPGGDHLEGPQDRRVIGVDDGPQVRNVLLNRKANDPRGAGHRHDGHVGQALEGVFGNNQTHQEAFHC
jgi:hypothetical protein